MYFTSTRNLRNQQFVNIFLFLVGVAITSYGIHFLWTDEWNSLVAHYRKIQDEIEPRKNAKYDEISRSLNWLIWLRLWVVMFLGIFFVCIGVYFSCVLFSGRR